ncbi:hypothetical protein HN51_034274 [Arachis hypogaea]|uniref:Uncharacterized protein n=1 Tax=Arachis hypogaea TaxID=3818 RepID=A0A445A8T7_ARAHY|nr:uncharacterized protein LOC107632296 [Arachis ipaensis]XP_025641023.1 uncharacterized protein LOC112735724 [Arachis hypogaea]QHN99110.1 uncharacterized protein DS421_13g395050 [Arachis hypogaea]RYR22871.1 hypothetical protein Ahy_B03g068161 [Arachis hypogaea]
MGACASSQFTNKSRKQRWQSSVNIIDMDGKLEKYKEPIKAEHALFKNSDCFLCSSEKMYVGSVLPHVDPNEDLQLDQIYFLVPLSKSHVPLSLKELCVFAIKANAALVLHSEYSATNSMLKSSSVSHRNDCFTHSTLQSVSHKFGSSYI